MKSLRADEPCSKWIYESDNGFQSLTSEVSYPWVHLFTILIKFTLTGTQLTHPIAIFINDQLPIISSNYSVGKNKRD